MYTTPNIKVMKKIRKETLNLMDSKEVGWDLKAFPLFMLHTPPAPVLPGTMLLPTQTVESPVILPAISPQVSFSTHISTAP